MYWNKNKNLKHVFILSSIFLISLAIRLYPALSAINLSPDAIEYIDQARHTARGETGVLAIKRHYFDHYPVVYSGIDDRPPLFPLIAAIFFSMTTSVLVIQVFNALLASLAVTVWYAAFRYLVSPAAALAGALAGTFSLWCWGTSILALTEPLSLLIVGLAAWIVVSGAWKQYWGIAGLGVLITLGYLTRHANVILLPAVAGLFLIEYFRDKKERPFVRLLIRGALVIGIASALYVPAALENLKHFGKPFYDPNTATFLWGINAVDRYTTPPPESINALVRQVGPLNYFKIITFNGRRYAKDILIRSGGLGPAVFCLPLLIFYIRRETLPAGTWFLLVLAAANIVLYSLTYGHYDPRYILLTIIPLFPLCFHAVERWSGLAGKVTSAAGIKMKLTTVIIILLAASVVLQNTYAFSRLMQEFPKHVINDKTIRISKVQLPYGPAEYERLFEEIESFLATDEIAAVGYPWLLHFFTQRPTARLPIDLDEQSFPAFLKTFKVRLIILDRASLGDDCFLRYSAWVAGQSRTGNGIMEKTGPFILYRLKDGPSNS